MGCHKSHEYLSLVYEIGELEDLLATIPEGHTIKRMSLTSRLRSVQASLAELSLEEDEGVFQKKRPADILENP